MSMQLPSSKRIGINQFRDEIFRNMTKILSDIGQGRGQPCVTDDEEFLMCQHSTPHVIYYVDLSRENTEIYVKSTPRWCIARPQPVIVWSFPNLIMLTVMEYLCHKLPRICSSCRKHFPVLSAFMTYHGFVTSLTRRSSLVEQELLTFPEHLSSHPVLVGFVLLDL